MTKVWDFPQTGIQADWEDFKERHWIVSGFQVQNNPVYRQ